MSVKCLICEGEEFQPFLACKDYMVSQAQFTLVACASCGFVFTHPAPSESEIGPYYQSEEYVSHSATRRGAVNKLYHWARYYALVQKFKLIFRLNGGTTGKMMDYGCGTGAFLSFCKKNRWNVLGIEPEEKARKFLFDNEGISAENSIFSLPVDVQEGSLDIVTAWHVFEHVHALRETIMKIKELLKKGGHLVVALPNRSSFDAKHYGAVWAAYDVPRHLYHFRQEDIIKLLAGFEFLHVSTLPMLFDSFYVSMLTEKYKGSKGSFMKGALRGLQSNIKAFSGVRNYSSQVYVFRNG